MYDSEYCDVSYDKARNDGLEGQKRDPEGKINFKYIYDISEINRT